MACAEEGAFNKAIIFLFIWYLQFLDSGKFIMMEKGKTNFQYELELKANAYGELEKYRNFKTVFEAVRYGGRGLKSYDFEGWRLFCSQARAEVAAK